MQHILLDFLFSITQLVWLSPHKSQLLFIFIFCCQRLSLKGFCEALWKNPSSGASSKMPSLFRAFQNKKTRAYLPCPRNIHARVFKSARKKLAIVAFRGTQFESMRNWRIDADIQRLPMTLFGGKGGRF